MEWRIAAIDLPQLLGALPAALIPVALVLYFSDQNTKTWMAERKETVLAILNERKEWAQERKDILERQFAMQERTVNEIASAKAENHALRNVMQQMVARIESLALLLQSYNKGGQLNG
jgi:hypothetical protein